MSAPGVFHGPDGSVLAGQTGPLIGNNIFLNIINSYSIAPGSIAGNGSTVPEPMINGRKLRNQQPFKLAENEDEQSIFLTSIFLEPDFQVVYKKIQPKARPHTQEQKKSHPKEEAKKPKISSPKNYKSASTLNFIIIFYS